MSHHEYFGNGYNFQQISSPDFHNYRSHGWDRGIRSGPSWQGAGSSGWDHMGGRGRREHPIMGLPDLTGRRGHRFDRGSGFPGSSNRGGRPAHLKGREIGMYYKHLSQKKKKKKIKVPIVELSPESQKKIQELLLSLDRNFAENMSLEAYEDTHFKQEYLDITTISFNKKLSESMEMGSSIEVPQGMDQELRDEHLKRLTNPAYLKMLDIRKQLPAYQKRSEILKCIRENQIAVISGDTGCGKTTQVGQLILDEALMAGTGARTRVLITQPRRIAATSVARRIANERVETLGNSVGYTIRLDSVVPRQNGSLEVVTAGVVLQRLQSDPALLSISHLLIDEVHERDATCDILLGIVKLILTKRKNLKLILMSATMDAERFSQYFGGCPLLHIPGIMFPIKEFYLEDVLELTRFQAWRAPNETQGPRRMWRQRERQRNQLIMQHEELFGPYIQLLRQSGRYNEATLRSLMLPESEILNMELAASLVRVLCAKRPPGAILVFLPGMSHISKLCSLLEDPKYPLPPHILLPLHSLLNSTDQNAIFDSPPNGVRKIIVSTNIAETSITIDDVVYVVDCGRMKLGDYDVGTDVQILQSEWVSQANAHQRRGRAGRVQAGECYRLYTRLRSDLLLPRPSPQLLRAPVHEPLLAILLLRLRPQFLSSLIDPPDPAALATAVTLLRRTGVLTSDESLTPLGVHVARLPVAPGAARMLIFASLFSAVAPISSVAAVVAFRDPFILPIGKEKDVEYARLKLSHGSSSDQLAAAEAQRLWAELSRPRGETFCHQHFLSARTMRLLASMREQFGELLHRAHFIPSTDPDSPLCNRNSNRSGLLKALIVAGLFPNVASYYSSGMRLSTLEDGRVTVHPGSVNARKKVRPAGHLVYRLKQRSTDLFLHDTSPAHAIPLIFFGDNFQISDMDDQMSLVTCGGLQWRAEKETGRLLSALRGALHKLLQLRLERPRPVNWNSSEGQLLEAIIELITTEDNPNLAMERQSMPNDQVDDEDEDQSSSEEEGDDFIPLAKRPSKPDSSRQCRV